VIRVEPMQRSWPCHPSPHRLTIYRARLLANATTRTELRRSTRAELLRRSGRLEEAREAYTRAIELALSEWALGVLDQEHSKHLQRPRRAHQLAFAHLVERSIRHEAGDSR